jgi:hypothetical protein
MWWLPASSTADLLSGGANARLSSELEPVDRSLLDHAIGEAVRCKVEQLVPPGLVDLVGLRGEGGCVSGDGSERLGGVG